MVETITTRTIEFTLDDNQVLHMVILPGVKIDYEDALDNSLVIRNLCKGQPILKLTDSRNSWSIDKRARELVYRENLKHTIARAVLVSNQLSSLLRNWFSELNSQSTPVKFFTDKDEAYQWLLQQTRT